VKFNVVKPGSHNRAQAAAEQKARRDGNLDACDRRRYDITAEDSRKTQAILAEIMKEAKRGKT
jgi:uncharacterized Fe-S cluster-containing protein